MREEVVDKDGPNHDADCLMLVAGGSMTVNTLVGGGNRAKTCPSPSFDARSLKSGKKKVLR